MNYAGNHLLHYIYITYKQKIFYHSHKVTAVQLLANGEFLTTAIKSYTIIKKNETNGNLTFLK